MRPVVLCPFTIAINRFQMVAGASDLDMGPDRRGIFLRNNKIYSTYSTVRSM
jgi:hypothetical protein